MDTYLQDLEHNVVHDLRVEAVHTLRTQAQLWAEGAALGGIVGLTLRPEGGSELNGLLSMATTTTKKK